MYECTTYRYSSSLVCNVFSHAFQLPTGHKRNKSSLSLPPSLSLPLSLSTIQLCTIQVLSCTAYHYCSFLFLIYIYLSFWHTFVLYIPLHVFHFTILLFQLFLQLFVGSLHLFLQQTNTHSHHLQYYWVLTNTHTHTHNHHLYYWPTLNSLHTYLMWGTTVYTNGKESCYQSQR